MADLWVNTPVPPEQDTFESYIDNGMFYVRDVRTNQILWSHPFRGPAVFASCQTTRDLLRDCQAQYETLNWPPSTVGMLLVIALLLVIVWRQR